MASSSSAAGISLKVRLLNNKVVVLKDLSPETTGYELQELVAKHETTALGKWKMMVFGPSGVRTVKQAERTLEAYGLTPGAEHKVEVIFDMGACHMTRPLHADDASTSQATSQAAAACTKDCQTCKD